MARERIISEVLSASDAKRVEETVKTGYAEQVVEALVHWMGVEEDLASSYAQLAKAGDASQKKVFEALTEESRSAARSLEDLKRSVEELDAAQVRRIEALERLAK